MIVTTEKLRSLCIENDWFTCGSVEQYDKLFYANENGCPIEEIATIIWLCSDEDCRRVDVLDILIDANKEYVLTAKVYAIYKTRGNIRYGFMEGLTLQEANDTVDYYHGFWEDENGFVWDLEVDEAGLSTAD